MEKKLTRGRLATALHMDREDLTQVAASEIVDFVFDEMKRHLTTDLDAIRKGERGPTVSIEGFGQFEVEKRKVHPPNQGEMWRLVPDFDASETWKKELNPAEEEGPEGFNGEAIELDEDLGNIQL